ncbi:heterokaryon incompatibility protein-domain-containing protein, partial [Hyaloscypha sp. PMI_1271]
TPYVTLSHRWSSYIPTLTKENLAQRLEGIPQETLPGTFRDAIQVTSRLGCSHLWIDSLCIIQDDPKDSAEESSRMGDIYRNGIFNIAATAANDRAPGLLQTRDPTTISSFKVKMTWKNHEKDYLLARFNIWNDVISHGRTWYGPTWTAS